MKKPKKLIFISLSLPLLFLSLFLMPAQSHGIYTEFGLSQSYKKTAFSETNYVESEMLSGSVSFYLWERVALEVSYTQGLAIRQEEESTSQTLTITQYSTVYGSDLILGFAGRESTFQPYIKGGVAYIQKRQVAQDSGNPAYETTPTPGYVPSYGGGLKIKLTENFGLNAGIDVWKDDATQTNDIATRTGLTWML